MSKSIFLVFVVLAVLALTVKGQSKERPEAPLIQECDEPTLNREDCFIQDTANLENWNIYLEEVAEWEKKNPKEATEFNAKNPDSKKKEKDQLAEFEKLAAIHN